MLVDRVYRYGCTRAPENEALALQLLGQAWLYQDALRRIYNRANRAIRAALAAKDDAAHVVAFAYDARRAEIRAARAERGHLVDHGTYWLVEDAVAQAAKASGLDPIRGRDFDGTGRIGAAIQSTERFAASSWTHKRVSLAPSGERPNHMRLSLVVGALSEGRTIAWPVKLHRPLPPGAVVKQVAMQRVRVGHRFRWEALVTIAFDEASRRAESDAGAAGVVGVDVGWRAEGPRRQRVATHAGSDGGRGVLTIDVLDAFEYADGVRSIRDGVFDDAKDHVVREAIPGGEHARLWRDKERMVRLAERTGRLGPAWWYKVDKHLEDIECGVRTRAIRRRLDAFRVYADRLARRYRILVLEDMPMSAWVGEAETSARERRRSTAALSLLQDALAHRFGPDRVHWEPSMHTTRRCSECGFVQPEGVGPAAEMVCASCGVVHHQDENAAENLRQLGERWIDGGNPPRARSRRAPRGRGKKGADGIATGDRERMEVTARRTIGEAAE